MMQFQYVYFKIIFPFVGEKKAKLIKNSYIIIREQMVQ